MMAVAFALGAALVVPAVSGMPTGIQATVAIYHHADWGQHSPRQRRIAIARNNRAPNEAVMVTAQSETTPAL